MKRVVIIFLMLHLVVAGFAQSFDYDAVPSHPRLLMKAGEESAVQRLIEKDKDMMRFHQNIIHFSDSVLNLPVCKRIKTGKRLLDVSRNVLARVFYLSYSYRMTGNEAYLKRAEQEMLAASSFSDWNPSHFLDVGEMCFGLAIGYDWLYDKLSQQTRETIRQAIVEKGFKPADNGRKGFYRSTTNWNQVCNGGLVCAALAIFEDERNECIQIIENAVKAVPKSLAGYAPDGGYAEGYQYWGYGTTYSVLLNDALEYSFGHCAGLDKAPGFMQSARFLQFLNGPSDECFNYSDAYSTSYGNIMMFWFASKLNDPSLLYIEKRFLEDPQLKFGRYMEERFLPCLPIFASRMNCCKAREPKVNTWVSTGINPVFIYREDWASDKSAYLGVKGGTAGYSHGHMDAGSFVYENEGVRWAMDLGMQDYYSLESKGVDLWNMTQNSQRWEVFRLSSDVHNTLTLGGANHMIDGKAEFSQVYDTKAAKGVEVDMASTLGPKVIKATRRIVLDRKQNLSVTDYVENGDGEVVLRWTMCTPAEAEIAGDNAFLLSKDGKKLKVTVAANAELFIKDNIPPHEYDRPNEGTCRIGYEIKLAPGAKVQIPVTLTMLK